MNDMAGLNQRPYRTFQPLVGSYIVGNRDTDFHTVKNQL
jgi:hypothetical protein